VVVDTFAMVINNWSVVVCIFSDVVNYSSMDLDNRRMVFYLKDRFLARKS